MSDRGAIPKWWQKKAPNAFFAEAFWKVIPEVTVVKLGQEPHDAFPTTIRERLNARWHDRVKFITVEVQEIDHRLELVRTNISQWREQLGWKSSMHTPTGYYVFVGIKALAFAPELPNKNERAAAFNEVTGTQGTTFDQFECVASRLAAERIAGVLIAAIDAFDEKKKFEAEEKARKDRDLAEKKSRILAAMKRPTLTQRDREALKLLGVPEDYTLAELTSAKRAAQKTFHPDVSKLSPAESTPRSAAYNAAFDVLRARIR